MSDTIPDLYTGLIIGFLLCCLVSFVLYQKKIKKLNTDPISNLPGYLFFLDELILKNKKHESVGIILIDLDNFKRFNRTSYETGDQVLKFFANELKSRLGDKAECARYRLGDEFIVSFLNKDIEAITKILAELNDTLNWQNSSLKTSEKITFAYGISVIGKEQEGIFTAIQEAQQDLILKKGYNS